MLGRLASFLSVAELRSFSKAARVLGMSPSAVSQAVSQLEAELDVVLLVRSTRSVRVTDVGARLVSEAGGSIRAAQNALSAIGAGDEPPWGKLRLSVPRVAVRCGLAPVLLEFAKRYPDVTVDVTVDDRTVDIVADGYDAGVRSRESTQKDMLTARLTAPIRFVVVGSPEYFASHGVPKRPEDLLQHTCLGWHSLASENEYRWEFQRRGKDLEIAVTGNIVSNDHDVLVQAALDGLGLAYTTLPEVAPELEAGSLKAVLESFSVSVPGLFLYYPASSRKLPKLRAFVDCALAVCNGNP
ncbi:MAG: LysR family transcriptional regulator [Polyangiaceae bacterium]|nr:LysR family transcriptional regulator [Polyangiaceae bacterium]MCB9607452.1 LysR family transcriptional regulator [Polyangiaceae bacterium]